MFKFPNYDKEPTQHQVWISRVPREGWKPGNDASIYICEKHFVPSDFLVDRNDTNISRKRKKENSLQRKRSTGDAIPSIWPNTPSHLTNVPIKPRHTLYSTNESRCMIQCERDEEIILEQSFRDKFGTIDELNEKIDRQSYHKMSLLLRARNIVFFKVSASEKPFIPYPLKIKESPEFQVWNNNNELTLNTVKDVFSSNVYLFGCL